jgi:hypothetical protein
MHDFLGKIHDRDFCCESIQTQSQKGANDVRISVANSAITETEWRIFLLRNINHCQISRPVCTLHPHNSSLFSVRQTKQPLTEQA